MLRLGGSLFASPPYSKNSLLQKLHDAVPIPVADIRERDPCGCNRNLSDLELLSLYLYTTEDAEYSYKPINSALCAGSWIGTELGVQIEAIDSALDCLASYSGECYRTEEENGRIHSKAKRVLESSRAPSAEDVVEVFVEFFMSSSLDSELALRGRAVDIVIVATHAGRDITHFSNFPDESEVLFKRDSRFLILEVNQTPDSFLIILGEI